jgi:hypothetical protein
MRLGQTRRHRQPQLDVIADAPVAPHACIPGAGWHGLPVHLE